MIKIILFSLLAIGCISNLVYAQAPRNYIITIDNYVAAFDYEKERIEDEKFLALRGMGFELIRRFDKGSNKGYVIKFWNFNEPKDKSKPKVDKVAGKKILSYQQNYNYFFLADENLALFSTSEYEKIHRWELSTLVLPTRLRFKNDKGGDFDFSSNYSIGTALGYRLRSGGVFSKKAFFVMFGANITSVDVDITTLSNITEPTNLAAFSPSFSLGYDFGNRLQFAISSGFDVLSKEAGNRWVYRDSPWLSLGIGIQLFNFGGDLQKKPGENKNPE